VQIVPPAQLFEIIDGGAELFLQYSFVALYTVELHNGAGDTLGLEIYRHADPLSAFGVYYRENDSCVESLNLFEKSCTGEHALTFRQGELYGKVLSHAERARAASPGLAAALARKLPSAQSSFPQFGAFPGEGLVAESQRYYPANYLGLKAMGPVFAARYRGATEGTAFYVPAGTPGRADSLVLALKAVYEGSAVKSFAQGSAGTLLHVEDLFEGHIVVRASGSILAGFISREESPGADALITAIIAAAR